MQVDISDKTYITLKKRDGQVENKIVFLYATVGWGKSLALESAIEEYHRAGYTILILGDVKDEFENCFAMFPPEEPYHLAHLKRIGKPINPIKVKIWHPITTEIPRYALPEINFYGLSLKRDLKREEWSMLAESDYESDTIRLLLNTCKIMNRNEGLFDFLHRIEDQILTKKEKKRTKVIPPFFVRTTPATAKSLQDITSYLTPFTYDYFLLNDDSPFILDWKNILNDNEHIHCFISKWIQDRKIKEFIILSLLNSAIRNKDYKKHGVLIVIPEIKELVPSDSVRGYKKYLANAIRDRLTVLRNMGKGGFSAIFDSQVWMNVEEGVRNMANFSLYGRLSDKDIEALCKALKYGKRIADRLKNPEGRNHYVLREMDEDDFVLWMPGFMHKEQNYSFEEVYKARCPERMVNYSELLKKIKEEIKERQEFYKKKVRKRESEEDKEEQQKLIERVEKKGGVEKVQEMKEKVERLKKEKIEEMKNKVFKCVTSNPDWSMNKVAVECGCNPKTAKKYANEMIELNKQKDNTDFEENALSEISPSLDMDKQG